MATVIEAGVDYFRLHTAMWSTERAASPTQIQSKYLTWLERPHVLQFKRLLGYDGIGDDYFFLGQREDGWLRSYAGGCADVLFEETYIPGDNPSRIDLQVTIRNDLEPLEIIQTHELEANQANDLLPSSRQRTISRHSDNKGGMTLYIGSRHSDSFGRIYHKYAKTKEERYKGCVRYEIELSGRYAAMYAEIAHTAGDQRARRVTTLVKEWFAMRGVVAPIPQLRENWRPVKMAPPVTSVDTTMAWLRSQVRPSLARLLQTVSREHILIALGLADEPDPHVTRETSKEEPQWQAAEQEHPPLSSSYE